MKKVITFLAASLALVAIPVSGSSLLHDAFSGTEVDESKWVRSGWTTSDVPVEGGAAKFSAPGGGHHRAIRSVDQSFDFHSSPITLNVDIASFDAPVWDSGSFIFTHLIFGIGTYTSANHPRSQGANGGFNFAITYRPSGDAPEGYILYLGGDFSAMPRRDLSGMPDSFSLTLDADSFSITLDGATFTSGAESGLSTFTGAHTITPKDLYGLLVGVENRGATATYSAEIGEITVIPEPSTYAALTGLLVLGMILIRRQRR